MTCVLIVDDEAGIQRLIEAVCRSIFKELHPITASDTQDAIEAYREYFAQTNKPPDLIITDLQMPFKNGTQETEQGGLVLTRVVHKVHPEVPVLILSGLLDEKLTSRALELGVVHVMDKGDFTSHRTLAKVLRTMLPEDLFVSDTNHY